MRIVIPFKKASDGRPSLAVHDVLKVIRTLAQDSKNVFVVPHANKSLKKRKITRRQIDICLKKGSITEGPFMNNHGNIQVNVSRLAAGEEITVVVAIEERTSLIVITVF
jgi:ABC-type histidine transport system ATPase subunit